MVLLFCRNRTIILTISCQKFAEKFPFTLYSVNKARKNKQCEILIWLVTPAFLQMFRCGGL